MEENLDVVSDSTDVVLYSIRCCLLFNWMMFVVQFDVFLVQFNGSSATNTSSVTLRTTGKCRHNGTQFDLATQMEHDGTLFSWTIFVYQKLFSTLPLHSKAVFSDPQCL